jgi:prolyl 4-hydroxylase
MELVFETDWLKVYDNVLDKEYCDELIEISRPQLFRQPLSSYHDHGTKQVEDSRTSNQCFIYGDKITEKLDNITNKLTDIPIENYEATSVIRYKSGQEYKTHYDFIPTNHPMYDTFIRTGGQRTTTALFYLSGEFTGGETIFFKLDNLKIRPKVGMCIIWKNMIEVNTINGKELNNNLASRHAGLPVCKGEKWIATKWIRENKWAT